MDTFPITGNTFLIQRFGWFQLTQKLNITAALHKQHCGVLRTS